MTPTSPVIFTLRVVAIISVILANSAAFSQANPVPFVSSPLVPQSVSPGGAAFTLTVNGAGFVSESTVNWNGIGLTTSFVSSSRLTAAVPAASIAAATTASITVINPVPGGGSSNVASLHIVTPGQVTALTALPMVGIDSNLSGNSVSADFNGDGKLDIAFFNDNLVNSANQTVGSVCIQLGNGDGSFQTPWCTNTGASYVGSMMAGDFNGDGKLDLVVGVGLDGETLCNYLVFTGKGDGTLQDPVTTTAGSQPFPPLVLAAADFDGDGKLDLAVESGYPTSTLSILLGNGDGTFQNPIDTAASNPGGLAVEDFNHDGILDLAFAPSGVLLGKGDGTFTLAPASQTFFDSVAAADLNGDGMPDLVSLVCQDSGCSNYLVSTFLGNGDGTFQAPISTTLQIPSPIDETLILEDVDGDGKIDIVSENLDGALEVLVGNGDGTFEATTLPINPFFTLATAADFNADGRVDFLGYVMQFNPTTTSMQLLLQGTFPLLTLSPASLAFGPQAVGTSSSALAVILTSGGLATLSISGVTLTGANAGDFSQTNNCGTTLGQGDACQINVTYLPTAARSSAAFISIVDNAPGSPHTVDLSGVGQDFSISASPPTQTVSAGQTATYSLSLNPLGGFSQTVQLSCTGALTGMICTVPSSAIINGSSATAVTVSVSTVASSASMIPALGPWSGGKGLTVWLALGSVGVALCLSWCFCTERRWRLHPATALLCILSMAILLPACNSNSATRGSGGTPPGTYSLTVTASFATTGGALKHSENLALVVQ
jgi:hypothetical protein